MLVPELDVTELAASLRFYAEVLEFRILFERSAERFAYLERDGVERGRGNLRLELFLDRGKDTGDDAAGVAHQRDFLLRSADNRCHPDISPSGRSPRR